MIHMDKKIEEAKMLASRLHASQTYDHFPYDKHLRDVVDVLIRFGYEGKYLVAGWLHDILEDCAISYNDLKKKFGYEIAEIVYCLTDELGRNRKERKEKTYPKLRGNLDAIVVKLADRIANVEHSLAEGSGTSEMYLKEYQEFKAALQIEDHALPLWEHLDKLLSNEGVREPIK